MTQLTIFLSLMCASFYLSAQDSSDQAKKVDSIRNSITSLIPDSSKIKSWKAWSNLIYENDPELDAFLNKKIDSLSALNLQQTLTDKERLFYRKNRMYALTNLGIHFEQEGQYQQALDYYNQDIEVLKLLKDTNVLAGIHNNIGIVHMDQGNYAEAIAFFTKSLKMRDELGDDLGKSSILNNIGIIHKNQKDYIKALEYFNQSLKLDQNKGDHKGMALSLMNIGNVYHRLKNYDQALITYQKCLEIRRSHNLNGGIDQVLNNIAIVYKDQKQYKKALQYYEESIELNKRLNHRKNLTGSYGNLAHMFHEMGDHKKALKYALLALNIAKEIGALQQIKNSSGYLWEIYKSLGRHDKALEMYELYVQIGDSISSEENQKAIIRQEYKYTYEKEAAKDSIVNLEAQKIKDARIEAEQAKNERNKIKIKQGELEEERQSQQMWFLGVILTLAVLFGLFIFNRFRITKKQRDIIDKQKSVVEGQKLVVEQQKEKVDDAYEQLGEKNQEILDSINYARRIQTAILPPDKLVKQYLVNSFVLYKPKDIVAGDFYWMEPFATSSGSEGTTEGILFGAADCTGHGVPGAMVSVVCNNGLNRSVREYGLTEPGQILDKTREIVISEFDKSEEEVKDGMDIALCSLEGHTLKYAGAHNPLWIIRKNAEQIEEIKAHKQPIGIYGEPTPYPTHTIELNEGDSFYIFSDGYADQFGGERGKKFKAANFKKLLLSTQSEAIEQQRARINDAFEDWKGQLEQLDDVCIIGVRV